MSTTSPQQISISFWTIVKILLVLLGAWVLYVIRDAIALLFVSVVLASALNGWVDWLERHRIPRFAGIILIYLVLFIVLSSVVGMLIPLISQQLQTLLQHIPQTLQQFNDYWKPYVGSTFDGGPQLQVNQLLQSFDTLFVSPQSGGLYATITGFFGGVISFILALVITLYIVVEKKAIETVTRTLLPPSYHAVAVRVVDKVQEKIGQWLGAQLILCCIVGVLVYIGLTIVGLQYALVLGLLAGILEFVPMIGPTVSSLPALLVAFVQSPVMALLVLIVYIVVQQFENHVIIPQVMRRRVGINPLVSVVAILIGAKLVGLVGVLLAIPVATSLIVIIQELFGGQKAVA